jgi:hypothetical protein
MLSIAMVAPWFLIGGSSPAQAQSSCTCPSGFSPTTVSNPNSPQFGQQVCTNGQTNQACTTASGSSSSPSGSSSSPVSIEKAQIQFGREKIDFVRTGNRIWVDPSTPATGTGVSFEEDTPFTSFMKFGGPVPPPGVSANLGMYIAPATVAGVDASGFGAATRNSGYGVTDSAGLLAPGVKSASFHDTTGGGTIGGFWDVSGMLSGDQGLILRAFYGYAANKTTFGDVPALGVVGLNIGSLTQDTHTFGASFFYNVNTVYAKGVATFDVGRGSLTDNTDGSTGSYSTNGYATDLRIGNVFALAQGVAYARPVGYSKAPPKPIPAYFIGLDLSGHVGYLNNRANGFTDSAGFVYGTEETRFGDVGARARLFEILPGYGSLWIPYVGATVDQQFGFSHTSNFPNQVQLVSGDIVTYSQAHTFWGVEGGLDVLGSAVSAWRVEAKGFYTASSDTNIAGGKL